MQVGLKALADQYGIALGQQVSVKLKKTYPQLEDASRAERVVEAVRSAFETGETGFL